MKKDNFFVSAIVPVYNGEDFLAEAIACIQKQAYEPLEIIVVDDGSTDGTAEIARQFDRCIRYIYQSHRNPATARNLGVKVASGNIIAFLDADDLWTENKLETQVSYLAANPSVEIVQGLTQEMQLLPGVDGNSLKFEKSSEPYLVSSLASAIYRRSVFDKIGVLDENLVYGEDIDWFLRARDNSISKVVLPQVSLFYRKHQNNMTRGKSLVELGFLQVFKKRLDRWREQGDSLNNCAAELPPMDEYIAAKGCKFELISQEQVAGK
jgi:glycosyltransferase involved in cell wall biosynthesis